MARTRRLTDKEWDVFFRLDEKFFAELIRDHGAQRGAWQKFCKRRAKLFRRMNLVYVHGHLRRYA